MLHSPLISRKTVTAINIDQKTRPPHPKSERRASKERIGAPDEINGSGMAASYFLEFVFSANPDSDRKNCLDTRCASRSKVTLVE